MSLRDGTVGQQALFALLVAVGAIGLALAVADKFQRIGTPNVGWLLDNVFVSPTREDAADAGLRGGGQLLRINGVDLPMEGRRGRSPGPAVRDLIGSVNTVVLRAPNGEVREVALEVRPWQWRDFVFTQGPSDLIAVLFLAVGVVTFALRPYEAASWALLSLCVFTSGGLFLTLTPIDDAHPFRTRYFMTVLGFIPYAPLHTALAFPVAHRLLARRRTLPVIYGAAALQAIAVNLAWSANFAGPFAYTRLGNAAILIASMAVMIGRWARLALWGRDLLVAQRARILLAGALLGIAPFAVVEFTREAFGVLPIDSRFVYWPLALVVLALDHVVLRPALLNARVAARKVALYGGGVALVSAVAALLVAVQPLAVALMLFPLFYYWPRFEARLDRYLYPQRARFPERLRQIGVELGAAPTVEGVLDVLAAAPPHLCHARHGVAFLLAGTVGESEHVRRGGAPLAEAVRDVGALPVVELMRATRREIVRAQLAVEAQYRNVRAECEAALDRLGAALLLPLVHEQRVVGGLAVGPQPRDEPYERAEIDALSTACQLASQAVMRVAATERLRHREREFAELTRFFSPQIIEQVMARGGAAELRTQRKLVTVVFADLRGFTSFSDSVEPEEVIATLDEYHAAIGARIAEYGGTLEHFAGDGFLVFFNDPVDQPDHATRAARMALAMRADVERLRSGWTRKGYQIGVGMGISTGYATCGFIGYEGRRDYAVIGNVANLAARLCDAAAPGELIISARVAAELHEAFACEPIGELSLKGFHQAQPAFRLLGEATAVRASG
jgi:class 3 adenylate cyclase